MYSAMASALQQANQDPAVRVIIINGTEGCFTSGNDVADFVEHPPLEDDSEALRFLRIATWCPLPGMRLPRIMGHHRASELLLLGEKFEARTPRALGLVNAVRPAADLAAAVQEKATAMAGKPPASIRMAKALLARSTHSLVPLVMVSPFAAFSEVLGSGK